MDFKVLSTKYFKIGPNLVNLALVEKVQVVNERSKIVFTFMSGKELIVDFENDERYGSLAFNDVVQKLYETCEVK